MDWFDENDVADTSGIPTYANAAAAQAAGAYDGLTPMPVDAQGRTIYPEQPVSWHTFGSATSAPTAPTAPSGWSSVTGWGWSNPNGGEQNFAYNAPATWTDRSWAQNTEGTPGYRPSVKEITYRALSEAGIDPASATPDQIIQTLRPYGINVQSPGPGLIDFGLGEGPIQVSGWRTLGNTNAGGGGGWSGGASSGLPAGFTLGNASRLASFSAPGLLQPWTEQFSSPGNFRAPTVADLEASPGYQARLGLGLAALQRSAAARGTLLTGGFMKDMNQFAQDYASNEYDKVYGRAASENDRAYGRALGEYQMDYGIYDRNQANAYSRLYNTANLGLGAAGAAGQFASSYGNQLTQNAINSGNLIGADANAEAAAGINNSGNWSNTIGNAVANYLDSYYGRNRPSGTARSSGTPTI